MKFARRPIPGVLRLWPVSALVLALAVGGATAGATVDPNSMLVEGNLNPLHLTGLNPSFSWVFTGPGTQTNWQVQVDSDPDFNGHNGEIWFWDSGTGSKGGQEAATSVGFGSVNKPGTFPRTFDTRADLIHWRLRIQVNNDPNWASDPNNFTYGHFKLNLIPLQAENVQAAGDLNPGTPPAAVFPALNPAPKEYFASPSGSDTNPGTSGLPFKTIGRGALALLPGDTLTLLAGTYSENVRLLPSATGVKNGTAGNPITIRAQPGQSVIVRGVTAGTSPFAPFAFIGSPVPIQHWVLDGVKLGGAGVAAGVYVQNGEFVTVRNVSFESNFNPSGTGVQILGGGQGNRVLGSKFDTRMFDQLEVAGSKYVEVRGNEFKNQNGHVNIHWHNAGNFGGIIEENSFHDSVTSEGAIFMYLGADGTTVRNNLFYNISEATNGYAAGVVVLRCGKVTIENNTFVRNTRGIGFNEFSRFIIVRNNIFFDTGVALDFRPLQSAIPGTTTVGMLLAYNVAFNNAKDEDFFYPQDANDINDVSNCFGGPKPSSNTACDPKFVSAATNDFRLGTGSGAIDAGDPNSPVPVGGGPRVDAGAREVGAVQPYDYQSRPVSDVTPRFSWSFVDRDNDLHAMLPASFTDTDSQTAFQLQIDTAKTFDSKGDRPIFDSGIVPSATTAYTVPDLNALAAGEFYVRVRSRDENQPALGAWSNNNIRIRIAGEPQPPVVTQQNPANGAQGVDPSVTITLHVQDFGAGVDSTTIRMDIGVNDPSAPTAVTPQISQVGSTPADYLVSFKGATPFGSGDVITVRIRASDLDTVPNVMAPVIYSFTIKDTIPPAPPGNVHVVP